MSGTGVVLERGRAKRVDLRGSRLDYLLTEKDSKGCSLFEFDVAPGFDTGRHYHTAMEEFFFVLEGKVDLRSGDRVVSGEPGTFVFVPPGVVHAITNSGTKRARLLLGCVPPGHENYFDELAALLAKEGPPDPALVGALRKKYDTIQVSGMQAE
jgi:quercetin dioxygenase-like cupin family protein